VTSRLARYSIGRAYTSSTSWAHRAHRSFESSSTSRASSGESHLVDLFHNENFQPWFLGINPRGLVPVLVHDGAVHIESNDIIQYLEQKFPSPKLIPAGHENEITALLRHEDDLHLDLRTLSFRFVFNPPGPPKPAAMLESYAANGTGTVRGVKDHDREIQIEFWQRAAKEGFTDERARASAHKFRVAFDALDRRLAQQWATV
jgi:glutathione S-transferase